MLGLLLQSAAWALPSARAGQAEQLAHAVAHALDHGHHEHGDSARFADLFAPSQVHDGAQDHDQARDQDGRLQLGADRALADSGAQHGPHHLHAGDSTSFQGLPVSAPLMAPLAPSGLRSPGLECQPPSADLAGWLRPPRCNA